MHCASAECPHTGRLIDVAKRRRVGRPGRSAVILGGLSAIFTRSIGPSIEGSWCAGGRWWPGFGLIHCLQNGCTVVRVVPPDMEPKPSREAAKLQMLAAILVSPDFPEQPLELEDGAFLCRRSG